MALSWCWRRGSNSHAREGRGILSPVRLPVPPLQQIFGFSEFTVPSHQAHHVKSLVILRLSRPLQLGSAIPRMHRLPASREDDDSPVPYAHRRKPKGIPSGTFANLSGCTLG